MRDLQLEGALPEKEGLALYKTISGWLGFNTVPRTIRAKSCLSVSQSLTVLTQLLNISAQIGTGYNICSSAAGMAIKHSMSRLLKQRMSMPSRLTRKMWIKMWMQVKLRRSETEILESSPQGRLFVAEKNRAIEKNLNVARD